MLRISVSKVYIKFKTCVMYILRKTVNGWKQVLCFIVSDCCKMPLTILKPISKKFPWNKAHVSIILRKSLQRFSVAEKTNVSIPFGPPCRCQNQAKLLASMIQFSPSKPSVWTERNTLTNLKQDFFSRSYFRNVVHTHSHELPNRGATFSMKW